MTTPVDSIFNSKYEEFAASLMEGFPELADVIKASLESSPKNRMALYRTLIMPNAGSTARDPLTCPGMVLPGVFINDSTWASCSEGTKKAINQFLSILTFSLAMKDGGSEGLGDEAFQAWADKFMNQWRSKMNRDDFDSFTKRFGDIFGSGGTRLPPFPERLRNGKLVKLAEEIVKELKPEEFGLDPETIKQCEEDPSKAFEVIMNTTMRNPERLQTAMKRIVKRLQEKFQRGEFKPQDLAAEAEEMMKEFSENPAFVDMMESMRKAFSFEDIASAKAAGQEHTARMNIIKERLRRKAAAQTQPGVQPVGQTPTAPPNTKEEPDDFASILTSGLKQKKKQGKK
jgi:hypothetical protein